MPGVTRERDRNREKARVRESERQREREGGHRHTRGDALHDVGVARLADREYAPRKRERARASEKARARESEKEGEREREREKARERETEHTVMPGVTPSMTSGLPALPIAKMRPALIPMSHLKIPCGTTPDGSG